MKIGTRSILFGVHQCIIHPCFVAFAWWRLYGFPWDPRLWVAFFVHDLGYWGKPNMDGREGEKHPFLGAKIMNRWVDHDWWLSVICTSVWGLFPDDPNHSNWHGFVYFHSRFLAVLESRKFSRLCVADKLATAITWRWLYLVLANLSGEIHEYMQGADARTPAAGRSQWEWITDVQAYLHAWSMEHRDCRPDTWTGVRHVLTADDRRRILRYKP